MDQINGTTNATHTKSIDVGGIFLLDLSVNESDSSSEQQCHTDYQSTSSEFEMNRTGVAGKRGNITTNTTTKHTFDLCTVDVANGATLATRNYQATTDIIDGYMMKHQPASNGTYRQSEYLGSSLDRLASVINCDEQQRDDSAPPSSDQNDFDEELTTMAIQQRSAGRRRLVTNHNNNLNYNEVQVHSSYSISEGSFAASSDASLSASYTGCSEDDEEAEHKDAGDKDSTTTREDSGVLDLRDLEGQLNSCSSFEYNDHISSIQNENQFSSDHHHHSMEKPISVSANILAKNLISSNKNNFGDYRQDCNDYSRNLQHPHRTGKPTKGLGAAKNEPRRGQTLEHHQQHQTSSAHQQHNSSRRRVSASVPIQVPARQMRKDLNKMKLNLLREEQAMEQELAQGRQDNNNIVLEMAVNTSTKSQNQLAVFEDDDAFLDQEYNANHQNHYPIDEHGDENLNASDDPMRLFASIQALARSLHEDAEIFGSLPPKRTLESPIRSMALV